MVLSIDEVNDLLDTMAEEFPEALFDGLNGGVNLLEEAVPDTEFPAGEMYILGEYCQDLLGNYINLYYGSFAALAEKEDWGRQDWEDELYTTFSHELTHHMESRGGLHALDDRDAEELAQWRAEYGQDVICAAVSALALNMANSVEAFTEDHFEGSVSEDGGSFRFSFPDTISPESQLLMKSLILGLQNIRDEYGAEYINFRFREV